MSNSIANKMIELEKEYFTDFNNKDYANFIVTNRKMFDDEKTVCKNGPIEKKCILLANDGKIGIWFAPAGNIPNNPEIIIMGQATSIPAMDSIMSADISRKVDDEIRKILINSSYKGKMLGNLGVLLSYLNINRNDYLSLDFEKEWENIGDCRIGTDHNPTGRLFEGSRDTKIMLTQFCIHCATTRNQDTGSYSTKSSNLKKYLQLNEEIYGETNYRMIEEKFFLSDAKLLITLSETIFKVLKKRYYEKYPNISWIENVDEINFTGNKVIIWIPHPSPGNLFYNRTSNKKGVLDTMVEQNSKGKEMNLDDICSDYPQCRRQAKQVLLLKKYFNEKSV